MNTPSVYQYLYMHSFSLNYHFTVMIAYNGYVEVNILVNPFCPRKNKTKKHFYTVLYRLPVMLVLTRRILY